VKLAANHLGLFGEFLRQASRHKQQLKPRKMNRADQSRLSQGGAAVEAMAPLPSIAPQRFGRQPLLMEEAEVAQGEIGPERRGGKQTLSPPAESRLQVWTISPPFAKDVRRQPL
jgi:hypothetical protein